MRKIKTKLEKSDNVRQNYVRVGVIDSDNHPKGYAYWSRTTGAYDDQNSVTFSSNMKGVSNPIVTFFRPSWPVCSLLSSVLRLRLRQYIVSISAQFVFAHYGRPLYVYREGTVIIYACLLFPTNFLRHLSTHILQSLPHDVASSTIETLLSEFI